MAVAIVTNLISRPFAHLGTAAISDLSRFRRPCWSNYVHRTWCEQARSLLGLVAVHRQLYSSPVIVSAALTRPAVPAARLPVPTHVTAPAIEGDPSLNAGGDRRLRGDPFSEDNEGGDEVLVGTPSRAGRSSRRALGRPDSSQQTCRSSLGRCCRRWVPQGSGSEGTSRRKRPARRRLTVT